jgi:hypothetical protein
VVTRSDRVVFHTDPSFSLSYDVFDLGDDRQMLMIHLDVTHFSKSVMKRIKEAVDYHRPSFPPIIFTQPANDSPLFEKFVSRFGWQFLNDCFCSDGLNRRIFVNYI